MKLTRHSRLITSAGARSLPGVPREVRARFFFSNASLTGVLDMICINNVIYVRVTDSIFFLRFIS